MKYHSLNRLATSALIAAIYAVLTMGLSFLSYNAIQFRLAEVLCLLPFFFPWTTWGVVAGCLIANLISAYGPADIVFGTLATLLTCGVIALLGKTNRKSWVICVLACLMPAIFNSAIVGSVIAWVETNQLFEGNFWAAFGLNALFVGVGELVVLFVFGLPATRWFPDSPIYAQLKDK